MEAYALRSLSVSLAMIDLKDSRQCGLLYKHADMELYKLC